MVQITLLFLFLFSLAPPQIMSTVTINKKPGKHSHPHAPDLMKKKMIDFGLVSNYRKALGNVDKKEVEMVVDMFFESAGFEEMFDRYSERIHDTIEKRLQDSLIIKN